MTLSPQAVRLMSERRRGVAGLSYEATRYAAKEAYDMSGLKPEDVHFAEVHDCFSIAEVVHLEDLGFFKPGEGYKAVEEGLTRLDGRKPINTSGGLKCKGHPVGATGIAQLYEIWKQLRGEAAGRQIPNPDLKIGAAHNLGGTGAPAHSSYLRGDRAMEQRPFSGISYEQFLNQERLMGSRCKKCDALFLPPRPICVECYGNEMEWVEMNGKGKLVAFTCIAVGPPFMIREGYD